MKHTLILVSLVFVTIVSGCSTSYTIQVVDGLPKEVYLKFSKGADVKPGDIFVLYQYHQAPSSAGGHSHGGGAALNLKHEVGRVRVIQVVDETHASVEIVSGQVGDGLQAEKVK